MARNRALALVAIILAGCMPVMHSTSINTNAEDINRTTPSSESVKRWADSVLASLTLREKAAQMVWPTVLGDYTSSDSPQWQRLTDYISGERVGGFTISVGSPTELAAKLNALQGMSRIPLLFGADL